MKEDNSKEDNKLNLSFKIRGYIIEEFNKTNKDNKKEINKEGKSELNAFVSSFSKICSKVDNIIKNKGYNPIHFYGIILCYLNHYDYENFKNI